MPVSEKQLAANRANALMSTGPRDTSKTKFNGIKHGLTAQHALLPWEHKEDLDAVLDAFQSRFQPVDDFERLNVKLAAEAFWRVERSLRMEAGMFETMANAEYKDTGTHPGDLHAGHLESINFMRAAENMDHYRRYDAHLQRAYDKALERITKMASLRRPAAPEEPAEPAPQPPDPEPEPQQTKAVKVGVLRMPLPRRRTLKVIGDDLSTPEVPSPHSHEHPSGGNCGPETCKSA